MQFGEEGAYQQTRGDISKENQLIGAGTMILSDSQRVLDCKVISDLPEVQNEKIIIKKGYVDGIPMIFGVIHCPHT